MKYLLLCLAVTISISGFAQADPLQKKLDKAKELIEAKKTEEADKYLVNLLDKNPDFGDGWDLLAKVRYNEYEDAKGKDNLFGGLNFKITSKDKNGKEVPVENDTLGAQLRDMMSKISPSKAALSKFNYTLRRAMLTSREAYNCSAYWRLFNIDVNVDTNVSKKAIKYFNDAEDQFKDKNMNAAALLYKRAIEEQPDFYKARLYLGDVYYYTANYADAISSFKDAVQKFPTFLEPRKYLYDAYYKSAAYEKALEECINAIMVYPDYVMFAHLEDAVYMNQKRLNIKWTARGVLPNVIEDTSGDHYNVYTDDNPLKASGPWISYQEAKKNVQQYCNKNGIIVKPNSVTASKYLELYSWEEMLKKSTDPALDEARRMQQAGYLDCYVLVTCYQPDFYKQYKDFVGNNREKIKKYYTRFMVSQ